MNGDRDHDDRWDKIRAEARFWENVLYLVVAGILMLLVPVLAWMATV